MSKPNGSNVNYYFTWQGQKDLNPRHPVLETGVLPTELYPYVFDLCIIAHSAEYFKMFFEKNFIYFETSAIFIDKSVIMK